MIRHLRLLAWLRWKYLWRASGRTRKIGAAVTFLVASGFSVVLLLFSSLILHRMFRTSDITPLGAWEIVHLVFSLIYLFWLYSGSFNDLYDPARLAPFPMAPRTLFLGSTLASFLGVATLLGGALLAGFAIGIPGSALQRVTRALLFAFLLVHLQLLARLIRLTFLAFLTSRRWRAAAVVLSTLIGGGMYMASQLLPREDGRLTGAIREFAESGGPSTWLAWCPAVWLSWAYQLDGLRSAAGLGAFALLTWLIYRAGGWAEVRLAFSEPVFQHRPKRAAAAVRVPFLKGLSRIALKLAGPVPAAVARKEFAVFFRDPAVRHRVLSSVIYILVPFTVLFVVRGSDRSQSVEYAGFFLIFAEMFFLTNLFGLEGAAVRNLLWFPASRRQVFVGKNFAYLSLFIPFNVAVLTVLGILTSSSRILPSIAGHLAALLVVVALGNVSSVYFPLPFLAPGQKMTRRDESGCLMALARSAMYALTLALLAPVLAASLWLDEKWWLPTALFGLVYALGLYVLGLKISERALLRREEMLGDYFRAA